MNHDTHRDPGKLAEDEFALPLLSFITSFEFSVMGNGRIQTMMIDPLSECPAHIR
jgi:hypothetical protein